MAQSQLYTLKVILSGDKKIWRRIEILGSQTLEELHEAIFYAFDRYDPHMYSFFMTQGMGKSRMRFAQAVEYTDPGMLELLDEGGSSKTLLDASETTIADLLLSPKGSFEYIFDFGDSWEHEIRVEKILDLYPQKHYPRVSEKAGASPDQYPDYDDEDEDAWEYDEDREEQGDVLRKKNAPLLQQFEGYLAAKSLSRKTINKHVSNIDFYINEFLLYEESIEPPAGVEHVSSFLGFWFIRKALWASVASIKENITSLKHFYTFMESVGNVSQEDLDFMKEEIKSNKKEWFETVERYDDPNVDLEDIW
ncbi:plasmid pRiA4b ORF-3 family protein [Desulfobulbus rhabdoformis]|uniref:plasmid pRiA4b ORF-3 family protein n=1 Tax=Desulfobulbus rhabdoformis TaxID=34032 RepID=UPI0019634861|nr:plasmid pRiA4b ORF-3 family protein [Desulfobulbus rhabdoformis]MBM9614237.1 plasmid pRiA4b ORF-3 family protein [Desulfobulbus rhabdoformis]